MLIVPLVTRPFHGPHRSESGKVIALVLHNAAPARSERLQCDMTRDREHPRQHGQFRAVGPASPMNLKKRVLRQISGAGGVGPAPQVPLDRHGRRRVDLAEGIVIAFLVAMHQHAQLVVGRSRHRVII